MLTKTPELKKSNMKHPKIEFKLSKEQEKETLKFFLRTVIGTGKDDFALLVRGFPELLDIRKLNNEKQDELIDSFVEKKYAEINKELEQYRDLAEKGWKKIEKQVFEEIQKLFGEDLSEEVYTAYLTLFERFRYNRELKFFFVPRKNGLNYINCVTIHETLHFIFFDYWNKNFKNRLQTNNLWMFSELFNVIVMNKEPFLSLAGQKSKPYPNHEAHYPKLKELFDQRSSLKEFFEKVIAYLEND